MFDPGELQHVIQMQEKSYRLLKWMNSALRRRVLAFDVVHSAMSMAEAAGEWIDRHCDNIPSDVRPQKNELRAFANLFSSYLATSLKTWRGRHTAANSCGERSSPVRAQEFSFCGGKSLGTTRGKSNRISGCRLSELWPLKGNWPTDSPTNKQFTTDSTALRRGQFHLSDRARQQPCSGATRALSARRRFRACNTARSALPWAVLLQPFRLTLWTTLHHRIRGWSGLVVRLLRDWLD